MTERIVSFKLREIPLKAKDKRLKWRQEYTPPMGIMHNCKIFIAIDNN